MADEIFDDFFAKAAAGVWFPPMPKPVSVDRDKIRPENITFAFQVEQTGDFETKFIRVPQTSIDNVIGYSISGATVWTYNALGTEYLGVGCPIVLIEEGTTLGPYMQMYLWSRNATTIFQQKIDLQSFGETAESFTPAEAAVAATGGIDNAYSFIKYTGSKYEVTLSTSKVRYITSSVNGFTPWVLDSENSAQESFGGLGIEQLTPATSIFSIGHPEVSGSDVKLKIGGTSIGTPRLNEITLPRSIMMPGGDGTFTHFFLVRILVANNGATVSDRIALVGKNIAPQFDYIEFRDWFLKAFDYLGGA